MSSWKDLGDKDLKEVERIVVRTLQQIKDTPASYDFPKKLSAAIVSHFSKPSDDDDSCVENCQEVARLKQETGKIRHKGKLP